MEPGSTAPHWQTILRRSLDIPDVVGEEAALAAVRHRLEQEFHGSSLMEGDEPKAAERVLETVLALLSRGELDDIFIPDSLVLHYIKVGQPHPEVERVLSAGGFSTGSDDLRRRAANAVEFLLGHLARYVAKHPFSEG
jgi:hypothetical protein